MAGRYSDWARVQGDTSDPSLLNLGRKLLGDLDTRRRLGGIEGGVLVQEAQLPDGRRVRARFVGNQPIVEMSVPEGPKKAALALTIEGFIVRPSPAENQWENADKNHVLLQPRGDGVVTWYFDDAHRPSGLQAPLYARIFPEGIGRYGNVDWINADASVVLSWMGASARYFGDTDTDSGSPWVFLHGQVLFDATADGALDVLVDAEPEPFGDVGVRGAAIRGKGPTTWLYVALRDFSFGEYLVRYKLRSPKMQATAAAGGVIQPAHLFADVQVDYASGELLIAAEVEDNVDGAHPFCFNPSVTEARRVYAQFVFDTLSAMVEVRYTRTGSSPETWERSTVVTPWTATTTKDASRSFKASTGPVTKTWTAYDFPNPPTTWSHTFDNTWDWDSHTAGNPPVEPPITNGNIQMVNASSLAVATEPSRARVPFAVDWQDGAGWVYAELYLESNVASSAFEVDPSTSFTHDMDDGPPPTATADVSLSYHLTALETVVASSGGFRTDFVDVPVGIDDHNEISLDVEYTYAGDVTTAVGNAAKSFAQSRTKTESHLDLYALDLRFGLAYYQVRTNHLTENAEGADSSNSFSFGGTRDASSWTTYATRLYWHGDLLHSITEDGSPTDVSDAITLVSASDGGLSWMNRWLDGGVYTASGFSSTGDSLLSFLGFTMTQRLDGLTSSWHRFWGSANGIGADEFTYADSEGDDSPSLPAPDAGSSLAGTHRDFVEASMFQPGSWVEVRNRYLLNHYQPTHRNSEDGLVSYANFDVPTGELLVDGAVRLFPIGYLSKTIVAIAT